MIKSSPILVRISTGILWLLFAQPLVAASADLTNAAQRGDLSTLQRLLESSETQIDAPSREGMTALLWAAQANDIPMVQALLEAGADASLGNRYAITPLWLAALNHSPALVELLLAFNADASAAMPHGETALMAAARSGDANSIELLIAAGADPNASESSQGETALMWAAAENHADAIRSLIKGGADPDAHARALNLAPMDWIQVGMVSTVLPVGGWTAAMYAARQNSSAALLALAEMGANLDEQDEDGTTALGFAIINAHYDLAAALLNAGADPGVADHSGMNALYAAIDMVSFRGDIARPMQANFDTLKAIDLVRFMLADGIDPNTRLTGRVIARHHSFGDFELGAGATPLMRAAKHGDLESMQLLLTAGADPELALESGLTVYSLVAGEGRAPANKAAEQLLEEFANNNP